jgi:hypothetical protein
VSCVQNADKTWTITTLADLFPDPWPLETSVRITGIQGATQLNGIHIVKPTSKTVFTTKFPIAAFPYTLGGIVTYATKGIVKTTSIQASRVTERKPGRPSYLSPGRRRARRAS